MKKRCIKKLQLHKTRISDLEQRAIHGGNNFTDDCITAQETICFSRCYGAQNCQFFQTNFDCQDRTREC